MFTQHSSLIQEFAEDTFCFTIWIFDILDGISLSIIKESAIFAKKTNRSVKLELRLVTPQWLCSTMFFSFIYLEKLHHLIRNSSEAEQPMQPQICLLIFALDKILFFSHQEPSWITNLKCFVPSMWKNLCPSSDFKKKLIASLQKSHLNAIYGTLLNNRVTLSFRIPLSTKTLFHALQHHLYRFFVFYYNFIFRYFFFLFLYILRTKHQVLPQEAGYLLRF